MLVASVAAGSIFVYANSTTSNSKKTLVTEKLQETAPLGGVTQGAQVQGAPDSKSRELLAQEDPAPPASTERPQEEEEDGYTDTQEDDVLLLQVAIGADPPLANVLMEAPVVKGKVYIPMVMLFDILGFPIKVDAPGLTAKGWYINQKNVFDLDGRTERITLESGPRPLDKTSIFVENGIMSASVEALTQWFPLTFTVNRRSQTLTISPQVVLPYQILKKRRDAWQKFRQTSAAKKTSRLQKLENPYKLWSWPLVDVSVNSSYNSNAKNKRLDTNYNIIANGEVGYLSSEIYAAGNSYNKTVSDLRVTLGRKDTQGNLLGFLRATEFSFGDITPANIPLLASSGLGRGVEITNRSTSYRSTFNYQTFSGNANPGWDAELYRNDVLIDFQEVSSAGRYEFLNIPIVFGTNEFRLVFYGPQGQVQEKTETFYTSNTLMNVGELEYSASVDEKNTTVAEISDSTSLNNQKGLRGTVSFRYGLTEKLTVGLGMTSTKLTDGTHQYLALTTKALLGESILDSNLIFDTSDKGWIFDTSLLTEIMGTSVELEHQESRDFIGPSTVSQTNPQKRLTRLYLNRSISLPWINDLYTNFNFTREVLEKGSPINKYYLNIAKNFNNIRLANYINISKTQYSSANGQFSVNAYIGYNTQVRASLDYVLAPSGDITSYSASLRHSLEDGTLMNTRLYHSPDSAQHTTLSQSIAWQLNKYNLSLNADVNEDGDYYAGVNLSFSAGYDQMYKNLYLRGNTMSSQGILIANVFIDDNGNNIYDPGEERLQNPTLIVDDRRYKDIGENGFIAPVAIHKPVSIELQRDSVGDPLIKPSVEGYQTTLRAGNILHVNFPLVNVSEISGAVYMKQEDGTLKAMVNIPVVLVDEKGAVIKKGITEFDGVYFITDIAAGTYKLTVLPEVLKKWSFQQLTSVAVTVTSQSDFLDAEDIILSVKKDSSNPK